MHEPISFDRILYRTNVVYHCVDREPHRDRWKILEHRTPPLTSPRVLERSRMCYRYITDRRINGRHS
jgi:hypothetical protein